MLEISSLATFCRMPSSPIERLSIRKNPPRFLTELRSEGVETCAQAGARTEGRMRASRNETRSAGCASSRRAGKPGRACLACKRSRDCVAQQVEVTTSKWLEEVRPLRASGSAFAVGGRGEMRASLRGRRRGRLRLETQAHARIAARPGFPARESGPPGGDLAHSSIVRLGPWRFPEKNASM